MHWDNRERGAVVFSLLFSSVVLAGPSTPDVEASVHEHALREHAVVRITQLGLEPPIRLMLPEEAVVWLNYSHETVRISIEDAATRARCREPSHFAATGDLELQSPALAPLESASTCLLTPGSYRYRVEVLDTASRPVRVVRPVQKSRFEGRLIVSGEGEQVAPELWRLALHHRELARREIMRAQLYDDLARLYLASGDGAAEKVERERGRQARATARDHEAAASGFEASMQREREGRGGEAR